MGKHSRHVLQSFRRLCEGLPPHTGGFSFWEIAMQRFWNKVKIAGPDECWIWIGAVSDNGYGKIGRRKGLKYTSEYAHRMSYELTYGPILGPRNSVVNHICSNRLCVNPAHLELVEQAQNVRVGRLAKLSRDDVQQIRKLYHEGKA